MESPPPPAVATPTPPTISTAPCRLPISYISEAYGWFVNYPGGGTTQDPTSQVALPGGQPGAIGQNPGLTYDRAARKWVPVPYDWLAPSGHSYAYETYPSNQIHAVSVPGSDAKLLGASPGLILFGVSDAGAYAWGPSGAFLLPFDGSPAQAVAPKEDWFAYRDNSIWGVTSWTRGTVGRDDLATGKQTAVGPLPGWYGFRGLDSAGNPGFQAPNTLPPRNAAPPPSL